MKCKYPKTLGRITAVWNKLGGEEGVDRLLAGELIITERGNLATPAKSVKKRSPRPAPSDLFEQIGEPVSVPSSDRFVARDKFVVDRNGELPISWLSDNFQTNFLDLVEENVPAVSLKQRKLKKRSLDGPIISALRGKKRARVALAHAFNFLKVADRSRWYIFYILDSKGVLWAVRACWSDDGWYVHAYSVEDPREWLAGNHVVSC